MLASETFFVPIDDSNKWPYWLVALVDATRQTKIAERWQEYGIPAWCPTVPSFRNRPHSKKRVLVPRVMLPRYLLIPAPFFESAVIQRTTGFHRFLIIGERLALIPNRFLDELREIEKEMNDPKYLEGKKKPSYKPGELVQLVDGVWAGIIRKIEAVDSKGMLTLDGGNSGRIKVSSDHVVPAASVPEADCRSR